MNSRDKTYIIILVILVFTLLIKSLIIDDYKPKDEDEADFKVKIQGIVEERYTSGIYKNLIKVRIVKISKMSEKEKNVEDDDGNLYLVNGTYKAKLRKYIFGILPYAEERILDINLE